MDTSTQVTLSDVEPKTVHAFEFPPKSGKFYQLRGYEGLATITEQVEFAKLMAEVFKPSEAFAQKVADGSWITGEERAAAIQEKAKARAAVLAWLFPTCDDTKALNDVPEAYFWKAWEVYRSDPFVEAGAPGTTTATR